MDKNNIFNSSVWKNLDSKLPPWFVDYEPLPILDEEDMEKKERVFEEMVDKYVEMRFARLFRVRLREYVNMVDTHLKKEKKEKIKTNVKLEII